MKHAHSDIIMMVADCCGLLILNCGATPVATEETHSRHS